MATYNMDAPMEWKEFKPMPCDVQEEYLNNLVSKYGATAKAVCGMFGVAPQTLYKHLKETGSGFSFRVGHKMSSEEKCAWSQFVGKEDLFEDVEKDVPSGGSEMRIDRVSAQFSGAIDAGKIAEYIQSTMNGRLGTVHISIDFE